MRIPDRSPYLRRHIISIQILVLYILEKRFTAAEFFSNELVRTETNSPQEFVLSSFQLVVYYRKFGDNYLIHAPHHVPSKKFAFHRRCARTHHPVKLTGRGIAQNEVSRDVWRPVAPVIPDVGSPVAAVGEGPDCGGFGSEGGGGEPICSSISTRS